MLPILALLACVWLLVLAGRQASAPPPEWDAAPARAAPAAWDAAAAQVTAAPVPTASEWQPAPPSPDSTAAAAEAAMVVAPPDPGMVAPPPPATPDPADERPAAGETQVSSIAPVPPTPRARDSAQAGEEAAGMPTLAAIDWATEEGTDPAPAIDDAPPLQRIHLAHATGHDITGYLRGDAALPPPVWGTIAALDSADALRLRLAAGRPPRLGQPQWRITADHATMTARIHGAAAGAPRSVRVELAWRNEMWLVDALQAEVQE